MQKMWFVGATAGYTPTAGAVLTFVISTDESAVTGGWPIRPGWRDVGDRVRGREADPARRQLLIDARKRMAHLLSARGGLTHMRLGKGLSRRDLAALSAIPESVLSRIEAGVESDPLLSVCRRLAEALDRSLDEIAAAIEVSGRKERQFTRIL